MGTPTQRYFLTIDSKSRLNPDSGQGDYHIQLSEEVRDVSCIKVRSMDFPRLWSVPVGRSSIWVKEASATDFVEVVIAPGPYDEATIAAPLKAALDSATSLTWTVTVTDSRIDLSTTAAFEIRGGNGAFLLSDGGETLDGYGARSIGRELGFTNRPIASVANAVTAPHRLQLDREEALYLHLEGVDNMVGCEGGGIGPRFAAEVIAASGKFCPDTPAVVLFHPPIARLRRLRVRIVDFYGSVVDFDNRDHRIDVVLSTTDAKGRESTGFFPK